MIHRRKPERLTRDEIKVAFKEHRGAAAELARELATKHGKSVESYKSAISQWLDSKTTSALIEEAARVRAAELLTANKISKSRTPRKRRPGNPASKFKRS
jgi:hypothetical protein